MRPCDTLVDEISEWCVIRQHTTGRKVANVRARVGEAAEDDPDFAHGTRTSVSR